MKPGSSLSACGPVPPLGTSAVLRCASSTLRQSRRGGGRLRSAKFLFTPPATPSSALPAPPARFFSKHPLHRPAREQRSRCTTARADGGVANGVKARSASVKAHIAQRCDAGANKNLAERSWPPRRRPRAPRFRTRTRTAFGAAAKDRNGPQADRARSSIPSATPSRRSRATPRCRCLAISGAAGARPGCGPASPPDSSAHRHALRMNPAMASPAYRWRLRVNAHPARAADQRPPGLLFFEQLGECDRLGSRAAVARHRHRCAERTRRGAILTGPARPDGCA